MSEAANKGSERRQVGAPILSRRRPRSPRCDNLPQRIPAPGPEPRSAMIVQHLTAREVLFLQKRTKVLLEAKILCLEHPASPPARTWCRVRCLQRIAMLEDRLVRRWFWA